MLSGRADLNRRPHGPEPCALSGLSHAPCVTIYTAERGFPQLLCLESVLFPALCQESRSDPCVGSGTLRFKGTIAMLVSSENGSGTELQ